MPVAILKGTSGTSGGCLCPCPDSPKNVSSPPPPPLNASLSRVLTCPRRVILSSQFGRVGEEERGRHFADIPGSESE